MDKTYITNSTGTSQGPEATNIKYLNSASGYIAGASSGVSITCIPNYQATLNIHARFDSAVKVQDVKFYIYDRTSINNPASGVTCRCCEIVHPTTTQINNGSGDSTWTLCAATGSYLTLSNSPGVSGFYAGNSSNSLWTDVDHDFYVCLSASPDSVGSKTLFGAYVELSYL